MLPSNCSNLGVSSGVIIHLDVDDPASISIEKDKKSLACHTSKAVILMLPASGDKSESQHRPFHNYHQLILDGFLLIICSQTNKT